MCSIEQPGWPEASKEKNFEYRVKHMRLTTLETRRKRGDLIQFFKIINKIDRVNLRN